MSRARCLLFTNENLLLKVYRVPQAVREFSFLATEFHKEHGFDLQSNNA